MGRKKIEIEYLTDERVRRVTFKKRRIGLLKKAIQLSKLTNARVQLKVYHEADQSFIEYYSHQEDDFASLSKQSANVQEYSKFFNLHYDLVAKIEERVTKYGSAGNQISSKEAERRELAF